MSAPPTPSVLELLDLADRAIGAWLDRATRGREPGHDLGREHWRTLVLLGSAPPSAPPAGPAGPAGHTMGEIAARAGVPAPTATRIVDRLVADGLVYRRIDPWDRRRVLVHVSDDGRALIDDAGAELEATLGAALAGIGGDARRELHDLVRRLAAPTAPAPVAGP